MKHTCIALLLTFTVVKACPGQQVAIIELHVLLKETESISSGHELKYPFVITADKSIQNKINQTIFEQMFETGSINLADTNAIKQSIDSQATDYMFEMSFETSLNKDLLLQLDVTLFGAGSYGYGHTHIFLFNIQTGHRYMLIDLIKPDKQKLFAERVLADQKDSLNAYMMGIEAELKTMDEDSATIDDIAELVKSCYEYMNEKNVTERYDYFIHNDSVIVQSSCGFPRYALVFQPYYRIAYPADYIKDYLIPDIYQQLISEKGKK